ncbi:MAG: nucleotidyl transferase AbiEii/AbiGii toxin family protein [Bacteroidia bacterium]
MSSNYGYISGFAIEAHKEAFRILLNIMESYSIRFFLIGAQARDVHFMRKGIKPARGTRDIDFAVMVDSMDQYNQLMDTLKAKGFEEVDEPYRLNWKEGQTVFDFLPFGEVEENHTVRFDERNIELSVIGYSPLSNELHTFSVDEGKTLSIPVPPLHGIFLLKLLSWNDKKAERDKDLTDLNQILEKYWKFVEDEAPIHHQDLYNEDFEMGKVAARILGRHLKTTISQSEDVKTAVLKILEEQITPVDSPGPLMKRISRERNKSLEEIQLLLKAIQKGVQE